jgi:GTP-binding protein Era
MSETSATRCGYVALIGAPNAGKSTLLNALVGAKVSIVSPKVQTTRRRVLGIAIHEGAQIIFVDTPGIFAPRPGRRLERAMVSAAWAGAEDADLVVLLVDVTRPDDADTAGIVERLKAAGRKAVLALNKVDLVKPPVLLGIADRLAKVGIFEPIFMISGLTGDGVEDLKRHLARALPVGPWLFPEDQLSDLPEQIGRASCRERV